MGFRGEAGEDLGADVLKGGLGGGGIGPGAADGFCE